MRILLFFNNKNLTKNKLDERKNKNETFVLENEKKKILMKKLRNIL